MKCWPACREKKNKPLKNPLKELVVVHTDKEFLADIEGELRDYVLEEVNVRSLKTCADPLQYCSLRAEPDYASLGKRLGRGMAKVGKAVKGMSTDQILQFEAHSPLIPNVHLWQNHAPLLQQIGISDKGGVQC